MSDYIDNIVAPDNSDPYLAHYLPLPASSKPSIGCALPDATGNPISLPSLSPVGDTKFCAPSFVEFPLPPNTFLPENCPNGLTFTTKEINVFNSPTASTPSGTLALGLSHSAGDFCTYDFNFPDLVIPCYPSGPTITGAATITVIDPNSDTVNTNDISVTQNAACSWSISGNTTIVMPTIPCPTGPVFTAGELLVKSTCSSLSTYVDRKPVTISNDPNSSCVYNINMPTLNIPCYPNGPKVSGGVGVSITAHNAPNLIGSITALNLGSGGSHYVTAPIVRISGGGGTGAVATATVAGGQVTKLTLLNPGRGYTSPPGVQFIGGGPLAGGASATADVNSNATIQNAAFSSPVGACCEFNLGGAIDINIPCSTGTGYAVTVNSSPISGSPVQANTLTLRDSVKNTYVHLPVAPTKPSFCATDIPIPVIDIPCQSGLTFNDFVFRGLGVNNTPTVAQTLHATNCSIGGTIDLPFPICETGLTASNQFEVYINGSNKLPKQSAGVRYNNLTLDKSTSYACGFVLNGGLNLGLGSFTTCTDLNIASTPVKFVVGQGADAKTTELAISQLDTCNYGFTQTTINIPTIVCDTVTLNPSKDNSGNTLAVKVITADGTSVPQNNPIKLVPADSAHPLCSFGISGTIQLPAVQGGVGIGSSHWTFDQSYGMGNSTSYVPPEGELCSYYASGDISPNVLPGSSSDASSDCWQLQYASAPGMVFPGFTVIRCSEQKTDTAVQSVTSSASPSKQWYKVIPASYLYQGAASTDRYYVFGLDTPFQMSANDEVYLELVFKPTSSYGGTQLVYAAVCVGAARDIAIPSSNPTVPSVLGTKHPFVKLLSPKEALDLAGSTYAEQTVANIVGLYKTEAEDVVALQKSAIMAILQLGSSTDTTQYHFKTYLRIAQAKAAVATNTTTGGTGSSTVSAVPATSNLSGSSTTGTSFSIKQLFTGHVALKSDYIDRTPITMCAQATNNNTAPDPIDADPTKANPTPVNLVTDGSVNTQQLQFAYSSSITANLLAQILAQVGTSPKYFTTGYTPQIGTASENIHVYYTLDGSSPTINTIRNKNSLRYDPTNPPTIDTTHNAVTVCWMAVYPEYSLSGISKVTVPKTK